MRDVILAVRADEAVHRSVNHHFSNIPDYYTIDHEEINISTQRGLKDLGEDEVK